MSLWLGQGESVHQASEGDLALHLEEGVKIGERNCHAGWELIAHLREEEGLLVDWEQDQG